MHEYKYAVMSFDEREEANYLCKNEKNAHGQDNLTSVIVNLHF